ncbi:hypothetical protein ACNVED_02825 [Legionella sp. D16C41]|uniref:hypothetical protein n=1 Tax=Legionella sp. D16C41 TaxID=3402688 RepID=UPI003AF46E14
MPNPSIIQDFLVSRFSAEFISSVQTGKYDVNEIDEQGNTILHIIANKTTFSVYGLALFLKAGINPITQNRQGKTAVDTFLDLNHDRDIIFSYYQLLEKYYPDGKLLTKLLKSHPDIVGCKKNGLNLLAVPAALNSEEKTFVDQLVKELKKAYKDPDITYLETQSAILKENVIYEQDANQKLKKSLVLAEIKARSNSNLVFFTHNASNLELSPEACSTNIIGPN